VGVPVSRLIKIRFELGDLGCYVQEILQAPYGINVTRKHSGHWYKLYIGDGTELPSGAVAEYYTSLASASQGALELLEEYA